VERIIATRLEKDSSFFYLGIKEPIPGGAGPSISIGLNLAGQAKRMGLIVEQAEDEIAAINMGIGASLAGAPGMVGTSAGREKRRGS